ncbi:MAG: hypothetical protein DHS20C17_17010 [Cyclobacteriaceae bacterium]|nr:MAG: hypothetical protein DHS20C17_17010 [Cyclobacteriaceae bacterium]
MKFDIIVIGAGSGGLSMGLSMHELGFSVLLIDKSEDSIGGECLNNGCIPSKALIHASKIIHQAKESQKFGLQVSNRVSMTEVMNYVNERQERIRKHENAEYYRKQGINVVIGTAKFVGKDAVQVGETVYHGKKIAIATGSQPRKLKIPGVENVAYYDNENIFTLKEVPETVLFIGAGPISMELGQVFRRLGAEVIMVEMLDRILINEAPEIAQVVYERSLDDGVQFHFGYKAVAFRDANTVVIENKDQQQITLNFNAVVVGIGREVSTKQLDLQRAGIETDEKDAIKLDSYLRTTNKNISVVGDAAQSLMFSHGAEHQATLIISNFFTPIKKKLNYDNFSWVTFTEPEVATFGLTEKQLKERNISYEKLALDFTDDDRAITSDYQSGKLVLYIKNGMFGFSDAKLLGGSMVAPNAGEIFQELVLARSADIGIKSLFDKIYAYPTGSRVNKTIVINKYTKALTPWMKKILKLLY